MFRLIQRNFRYPIFKVTKSRINNYVCIALSIPPYSVQMRENEGKRRTRMTPNTDTFYAVFGDQIFCEDVISATIQTFGCSTDGGK